MVTCEKIESELQKVINFRIGDGASEKYPLIFDKKTICHNNLVWLATTLIMR